MAWSLAEWSTPWREQIDALLVGRFADAWPPRFAEAVRYPLTSGGKRVRPLLAIASAQAAGGGDARTALAAGCAVELVHSYSLVHDDLPALDDDDERRGQPTVHRAFDEATAVLVGDALLTEAFRLLGELARDGHPALVWELADAAGHVGMIGGQAADIGLGGPVEDIDALVRLHRGKTGAIIRAACRMGALVGRASPDQLAAVTRFGEAAGLAFQLADDVLDADQDAGRTDGGPPSYVKLLGLDETRRRAHALVDEALAAAATLPFPDALQGLARYFVERET